jgi:pyruvate,water dikinase
MTLTSILPIENIKNKKCGGKAKGLALLKSYGYDIPKTWIITSFNENEIKAFASQISADKDYAIRSSANAEDGAEYSYAGQFDTFLNVKGVTSIVDAVKKCFLSADTFTVEVYKKETQTLNGIRMFVLLQEMVEAKYSGVVFTADPVTQRRDMLTVSIVQGLGEKLMSGHIDGENLKYFKHSTTGVKSKFIDQYLLKEITRTAVNIEKKYGMPADLEWAIDKNGKLWWLQLRPVTGLHNVHFNEFDSTPNYKNPLYTRGNIGEMMPGPVTPLTLSTFARAIEIGLQRFYKKVGVPNVISDKNIFVHCYYNHLFFDLNAAYEMVKVVSISKKENIDYSITGELVESDKIKKDVNTFKGIINSIKMFLYINSAPKAWQKLKDIYENFEIKLKDNAKESYSVIDSKLNILYDAYSLHYVTSAQSGSLYSAILNIYSKGKTPGNDAHKFASKLFNNIPGVESADVLISIDKIAKLITNFDKDGNNFVNVDDKKSLYYLTVTAPEEIKKAWKYFIKRHGHRCVREAEMYEKEWAIDPTPVIHGIKAKASLIIKGFAIENNKSDNKKIDLNNTRLSKKQKFIIRKILPKARKAVARREQTKAWSIGIQHNFKKAYRILAKQMVKEGLLQTPDEIFFLTHSEIGKLVNYEKKSYYISISTERMLQYPKLKKLSFPDISYGIPVPENSINGKPNGNLTGIPVSRGIVEGKVRIVKNLEEAKFLKRGEIMVARFTDIGWTPYFSIIKGVITEIGSPLSHGSVVAREYGLPAVVSMKGVMDTLKTGQKIKLDAIKGEVIVLK